MYIITWLFLEAIYYNIDFPMFKTNKCNHGDKGMCINCLLNKQKQINKGLVP